MYLSIRSKLLLYMIVNSVLFAALLFGFNTFFAEKYYIHSKKNTLIANSERFIKLLENRTTQADFDENLLYQINSLEKSLGCNIFIGTLEGKLYYPLPNAPGAPFRPGFMSRLDLESASPHKPPFNFLDFPKNSIKDSQQYNKTSIFFITEDPNFKIDTLRFQSQLDTGLVLLIWVPMASISEGAYLSNHLTAVIGLITMSITVILTFLISKRFINPITKMNTITKKMSNLDFSETLHINGSDELGQLSHSINQLSSNLDTAITELNMKNKQLERDIDKERSLDKMRREFISNVSHELKTPIFLIQGYSEGLKANVAATEEKRNFYCDVIMEETEKMDALVHGLLNLAQLESDTFTMLKTHFNISKLMRGIFLKYAPIFKDKQIKQFLILQEDYMTYADSAQIEQVIINFINNAIDHVDANKIIRLTAFRKDDKLRISIYNSGSPIPHQELGKIWTSFYKIDKARTRDLGGTGLGLSIVRAILDAHRSVYGVFNVEDGVEFWFELSL